MALYVMNDNLIIRMTGENITLKNGVTVTDTRGKRDIVSGQVVCGTYIYDGDDCCNDDVGGCGDTVWFPMYAATPIVINGESLYAVSQNDIILCDTGTQTKEEKV